MVKKGAKKKQSSDGKKDNLGDFGGAATEVNYSSSYNNYANNYAAETGASSQAHQGVSYTNGYNSYSAYPSQSYPSYPTTQQAVQYPTAEQVAQYQAGHYSNYPANTQYSYGYQTMDYNQYANAAYGAYGSYPPGYGQQAQGQQYQASPAAPQIRNPFAPPPPPSSTYAGHNASFDPDYEAQIAQWQSAYAPAEQQDRNKKGGRLPGADGANAGAVGQGAGTADGSQAKGKDDGKYTVVRKGGGEQWEDKSLLEWDPKQFRIMVGNLAGEVTDDSLAKAFANYGVSKARVVRDKRTTKSKGFGFVAFTDAELGFKAAREMSGKYIGSHPVTIARAKTNVNPVVRKDQNKNKGKNNNQNKNKDGKKDQDPLRANTHAGIEKKPPKTKDGMKFLG